MHNPSERVSGIPVHSNGGKNLHRLEIHAIYSDLLNSQKTFWAPVALNQLKCNSESVSHTEEIASSCNIHGECDFIRCFDDIFHSVIWVDFIYIWKSIRTQSIHLRRWYGAFWDSIWHHPEACEKYTQYLQRIDWGVFDHTFVWLHNQHAQKKPSTTATTQQHQR